MVRLLRLFSLKGLTWREVPPMIVLVVTTLWVIGWTRQYNRDHAPTDEYFIVRQLAVPDHEVGTNPVISYDRVIQQEFWGQWVGEIQSIDTFQAICSNDGRWKYDPPTKPPKGGFTLDWFMDKKCNLPPGTYRLQSCWKIERKDAVLAELCRITAPFNVFVKEHTQ